MQFVLYTVNGERLRDFSLEGVTKPMDLTDLPAGLYILHVSDGENRGTMRVGIVK